MANQIHVLFNQNGGWDVKRDQTAASIHAGTKAVAVMRARVMAKKEGTELIIHNKNGEISPRESSRVKKI